MFFKNVIKPKLLRNKLKFRKKIGKETLKFEPRPVPDRIAGGDGKICKKYLAKKTPII